MHNWFRLMLFIIALPTFGTAQTTYNFIGLDYGTFGNETLWENGIEPPSGVQNAIINIQVACNFDIAFTIGTGTVMNVNANYFNTSLNAILINNGTLNVNGGSGFANEIFTINTSGTFTNNGVVNVNRILTCWGGVLNNNATGTINVYAPGNMEVRSIGTYNNSGSLILHPGSIITHQGTMNHTGSVTVNNSTFNNFGTLTATAGTISILSGGLFSANGTTNLNATSQLTNEGFLNCTAGTFTHRANATLINNGSLTHSGGIFNSQGFFRGSGIFNGNLYNSGTVSPGTTTPATMTITSSFFPSGTVSIEVGSTTDVFAVTGNAVLSGTLTVNTVSGYLPPSGACGQSYDIITCASRTGTFSTVNLPSGWKIQYLSNGVRLKVDPAYNTFTGGAGTDLSWTNPANWLGCEVPLGTVNYPINIAATCIMDTNIVMNSSLTVDTMQSFNLGINDTLKMLVGKTLTNRGTLAGAGRLENNGTILNTSTVFAQDWENNGTINNFNVLNSAFNGSFINKGTIINQTSGTLRCGPWTNTLTGVVINHGVLKFGSNMTNLGVLKGNGQIEDSFTNGGTLEPGNNAVGSMSISGFFTQSADGVLKIEIGGAGAGQFDQLIVSNAATLAGDVHITLVNGFVPTACSEYQIIIAFSAAGTLNIVNQLPSDWEVIFGTGGVKLRYSGALTSHTFTGGGGNTLWSNNDNWLECVAPPDNVVLPVTIQGFCWIDRDVVMNNSLTVDDTKQLQINSGKSLKIAAGQNFVNNGSFTNYGLFELAGTFTDNYVFANPSGSSNDFKTGSVFNANATNAGFAGTPNFFNGTINIASTGFITSYANVTIGPTGIVNIDNVWAVNGSTLTNTGTININADKDLYVYSSGTISNSGIINNNGLIEIPPSNTLTNQGTLNNEGEIRNEGTLINSAAGELVCNGTLALDGTYQNAGTLSGIGSITPISTFINIGKIAPGGSPGTLTVYGAVQLSPNSNLAFGVWGNTQHDVLNVTGAFTLDGSLSVTVSYTPALCTELTLINAGTLNGSFSTINVPAGWAIEYGATYVKLIYGGTAPVMTFTNSSGDGLWSNRLNWNNCVLPYSAAGSNNVHIVIAANCTLDVDFSNSSQLTINPGVVLTGDGDHGLATSSIGTINVLGSLSVQGYEHDGVMKGTGTITEDLVNEGHIQPGTSPGTLTLTGDYDQDIDGILDVEINGSATGQFDRLNISGNANLSGTINVTAMLSPTPTICTDFVIIQAASVSGTFDQVNLPNTNNWAIRYTATQVIIRYTPGGQRIFIGGGGNDLWSNDANWAECAPPPSGYNFPISINAPCTLDVDFNLNAAMSISNLAPFTISNGIVFNVSTSSNLTFFTLTNNGSMNMSGSMNMDVSSYPSLVNNGTMHINASSDLNYYRSIVNTGDLLIHAPALNLYNTITSTGAGTLDVETERFFRLHMPNGSISTVDGNLQIDANPNGTETGNFEGVELSGPIISTGTGNITISAHGGDNSFGNLSGIHLMNNAKVESTGSGSITISGYSGDDSSISGIHAGVLMDGNSEIKTNTGALQITGTGGTGGSSHFGIALYSNAKISSTGSTGHITLHANGGTGQGGSNPNLGLNLTGGTIRTHDGNLSITATAGPGSSNGTYGVYASNATIQCTGSGDINISGTGGTSGNFNHGILLQNSASIKGKTGPLSITALAGFGNNSDGIRLESGTGVHNGSGSITISGVANGFGTGINAAFGGKIGGDTTSNRITLIADTYNGGFVQGTGQLNIRPFTASTAIGIGFGSPGTLHFDNSEINNLQNGFSRIIIGDLNSGTGLLTASGTFFQDPLTLVGGAIDISSVNANQGQMQLVARTGNVRDLGNGGFDVDCDELSISTPNGALAPGNSPGLFRIDGNYTHTANYEVEIEGLSGPGSGGGQDQLQVNGTLNLGGTLTVKFINGYVPSANDQFVLAYGNTLNGTFSTVIFEPSNITGTIQYINNQVILSNIVLPVTLLDFDAFIVEKAVQLNWSTASEVNNKGFFIERSGDGQNWQELGFIDSKGNSTTIQRYKFEDLDPIKGLQYYRLRQVDHDGTYAYSDIRQVNFRQSASVQVWPNPTKGWLQLQWPENTIGQVQLFDVQGRLVLEQVIDDTKHLTLDLSGLQSGVYQLVTQTEAGITVERVVLAR
jgi:hypothetical protein